MLAFPGEKLGDIADLFDKGLIKGDMCCAMVWARAPPAFQVCTPFLLHYLSCGSQRDLTDRGHEANGNPQPVARRLLRIRPNSFRTTLRPRSSYGKRLSHPI